MALQLGRKKAVGLGIESTAGTIASSFTWIPWTDFDPEMKVEYAEDDSAIGRIEEISGRDETQKESTVKIKGYLRSKSGGLLLKGAFGTVTSTASTPEAGVTSHAVSVKNDTVPVSYSVVWIDSFGQHAILNAVVDKFTLKLTKDKYAEFEMVLKGNATSSTTGLTDTLDADDTKLKGIDTVVKFADTVAGLGAATAVAFVEANISIEKKVKTIHTMNGSVSPEYIANTTFKASAEFTCTKKDSTYTNYYIAGTPKAMRIALANNAETIGLVTHPTLTFDFAPSKIFELKEKSKLNDFDEQTFSLGDVYSIADGMLCKATLLNTQASY